MTERESRLAKARFGISRRVTFNGYVYISVLRRSYPWMTDEEYQHIEDELVSSAVAKRVTGSNHAEQLVAVK